MRTHVSPKRSRSARMRLLDNALLRECAGSPGVLGRGQPEEQHAAEAETDRFLDGRAQGIDELVVLPWHRPDRLRRLQTFANECRVDQLAGGDPRLAGKAAQCRRAAEAAGSVKRKSHDAVQRSGWGARHSVSASSSASIEANLATAATSRPTLRASMAVCSPRQTIERPCRDAFHPHRLDEVACGAPAGQGDRVDAPVEGCAKPLRCRHRHGAFIDVLLGDRRPPRHGVRPRTLRARLQPPETRPTRRRYRGRASR